MLRRREQGPHVLSDRERRILTALAGAALPAGKLLPAASGKTVARLDAWLGTLDPSVVQGYRALLWTLEGAAWIGRRRSLADLDADDAEQLLQEWRHGGYLRRNALRALLAPIKATHYDDPGFYRDLGCVYQAPPVAETPPRWMSERVLEARDVAGETIECDVVIIGTGAGGAVVARELAQHGAAVVMLEEGDYFTRSQFTGRTIEMQQRMYRGVGGFLWTVGNVSIPIPVGRTVGGSTTVNSGTCYRAPERVLAEWGERHGLDELSPDGLAPYYARVEAVMQVRRAEKKYLGRSAELIARGCDALGYTRHHPLLRNAPDCDGQGVCCFGCPSDAKRSTNVSYVPLALQRGAMLVKRVRADEILVENGRAVGVRARAADGTEVTVRARAVVVACGSLLTPGLLERQRLGGRSGQLGRNLTIHPATAVMALFDEKVDGYRGIPQGYAIEEFHEEGILFEGAFGPPEVGAVSMTQVGRRFVDTMEAYDRLACFGFMIEDSSSGRVRRGPGGQPLITYFLNKNDVSRLRRGIEILSRIFFAAGARRILSPIHGFEEIEGEGDLARLRAADIGASDFDLSAYHPLGTARMGRDPARSVVGPDHQLHDLPGLYVADGSVIPSSLAVNPQLTIMAMATRAADGLAARLS